MSISQLPPENRADSRFPAAPRSFYGDSWLNVDGARSELRPPAAPTALVIGWTTEPTTATWRVDCGVANAGDDASGDSPARRRARSSKGSFSSLVRRAPAKPRGAFLRQIRRSEGARMHSDRLGSILTRLADAGPHNSPLGDFSRLIGKPLTQQRICDTARSLVADRQAPISSPTTVYKDVEIMPQSSDPPTRTPRRSPR